MMNHLRPCSPGKSGRQRGKTKDDSSAKTMNTPANSASQILLLVASPNTTERNLSERNARSRTFCRGTA